MTKAKYRKYLKNTLRHTVPAFAIFFTQLATGVSFKQAFLVALLAFYGNIADLLSKYKN